MTRTRGRKIKQRPRFEIYQDKSGSPRRWAAIVGKQAWRWRLVGANGKILADSGEAYTRKADVKRALGIVLEAVDLARIIEVTHA